MKLLHPLLAIALLTSTLPHAVAGDGNRLAYLDGNDPYAVSGRFPKLTTPQWVGEKGVEAVVVLGIDDMRDATPYETFLRPILDRLKAIDGRAALSIMTNKVKDPKDPLYQQWLAEGVSLDVHTIDHPCPRLQVGGLERARSTYDRCVDQMHEIPGNIPVAFRLPCCDSINSPGPRFFAEIFNKTTTKGHFLTLDSSVLNLPIMEDPTLRRSLVRDSDGGDRLRKYLPENGEFVNYIENYPYPYVINRLCWEIPCSVPSDWEGFHIQGAFSTDTVADMKAALDMAVLQKGIYCLVFHPHGWIQNTQVVGLIDYVTEHYGGRVKFLNYAEVHKRLNDHLLAGQPLRAADGGDNGVRLLDVNHDGYMDVVTANSAVRATRIWSPNPGVWKTSEFPVPIVEHSPQVPTQEVGVRFGVLDTSGNAAALVRSETNEGAWVFDGEHWAAKPEWLKGLDLGGDLVLTSLGGQDRGVRLHDLDGDGKCELVVGNDTQRAVFAWSESDKTWHQAPFHLPEGAAFVDKDGVDKGLRFVDVDDDGLDDILFSNEKRYSLHLFAGMEEGFAKQVVARDRGQEVGIPAVVRHGEDNGAWFRFRHMWLQNELTGNLPHQVAKLSFNDLLADIKQPAKSPEASLHALKVRPGFRAELVASEPLTMDPINFDWGSDGKLWVVEMGDYPSGLDNKGGPGGRIRYLEDTDGDGKYDRSTLFLDKLNLPTSVLPWGKGVLILCAPDLIYAEDSDGDGRADIKRTLYTGFGEKNPQHRANGLVCGLDNWLYIANGGSDGEVESLKTGDKVEISLRDLRIHPEDGALDSETGETQFGRARDDWGNWFGCNNCYPMFHFVIADRYVRRNPFVAPPMLAVPQPDPPANGKVFPSSHTRARYNDPQQFERFTSACSVIRYRDDLFGPGYEGNMFVCEPVHNLVHREILAEDGTSFTSRRASDEQRSEFFSSTEEWFRPATIKTGPDGALWVADMYRWEIEHPQYIPEEIQRQTDFRAGEDKGRIYRIYPVDSHPRPIPILDSLDAAGLVAALDSPNGWQRDRVQMLLVQKQDPQTVPLLEDMALHSTRATARLHALCTLDGMKALKPELVEHGLLDPHPGVRREAVRLSEGRFAESKTLGDVLLRLTEDPDPKVRLQLACTLGEWEDARAGKALGQLALRDFDNPYIIEGVMSSINKRNLGGAMATVLDAAKDTPPPGDIIQTLLGLAVSFEEDTAARSALAALSDIPASATSTWKIAAVLGLLDALDREGGNLSSFLDRMGKDLNPARKAVEAIFDAARQIASNEEAGEGDRVLSVQLLGRGTSHQEEDIGRLSNLLSPQSPEAVREAAVDALKGLEDPEVPKALIAGWNSYGPDLRSRVLDVLLGREAWTSAVLDAVAEGKLRPNDIDAARRYRLFDSGDEEIQRRAKEVLGGSIHTDREEVVQRFAPAAFLPGNPEQGKEVFSQLCATCHLLGDEGHEVGANLSTVADKAPPTLLASILDPNRAVDAKFVNYVAETSDGSIVTGILTSETGNSITLVTGGGVEQVLLRTDIESLTSTGKSLMPEGLEEGKTPQDFADLIAFIRGQSDHPKQFEGNHPEVVKAGADGIFRMKATNCEIYGDKIVYEDKTKNLGYWASDTDRAVWSIEALEPGEYDVWLDWAAAEDQAGKHFFFSAGEAFVKGEVESTGSWDHYEQANVGEILLGQGPLTAVFRSAGHIAGNLLDLREVLLVPAGKEPPKER
jgi:putative membrane-bound dehydrogenase-like protein